MQCNIDLHSSVVQNSPPVMAKSSVVTQIKKAKRANLMDKINKLSNAAITINDESNTEIDQTMPTKKDLIISDLLGIQNTAVDKNISFKKDEIKVVENEKENDAV